MLAYKNLITKRLRLAEAADVFDTYNYRFKLITSLIFKGIYISASIGDIKYNDHINDNRWHTARGDSCSCC